MDTTKRQAVADDPEAIREAALPVQRTARLDAYPYDVTPDGDRFLVDTQIGSDLPSTPITFVTNWTASLRR